MKEVFLNHSLEFISNSKGDLTQDEKEKLAYGLEGLYMTITKLVVIFLIAIIFGFVKEFLFTLIMFNIIRYVGFGYHANKSIICLISSTALLLGLPFILLHIKINLAVKIFLCIVSIITFIICAPADTAKRPLTNKKKRRIRKTFATCFAIIYSILVICLDGSMYSNLILAALLIETILISPIFYMIFGDTYNNYKKI